jgi:pimeloyl-ACP methyl ester carboxylesterase
MAADALDWKRFTLLGHSLGASIACFVAAVAPERVAQLALIESLGPLTASPSEAPAQLAISLRQTQALHQKQKPPPIYAHRKAAIQARQQAGVSYLAAATLAERGLKTVDNGFSWRSDPWLTVKSPVYLCEEQVLAFLAAIQAPTLLIQAESGYLVKRKTTAKRQQQVRHLKCKVLAGNHHLHLEDPAPTAAALREFFSLQKSLY